MPQNAFSGLPFLVKIFAVTIGAMFALMLSGDIDKDGKLNLSLSVLAKFMFSAYFGLTGGSFLVEWFAWDLSVMSQSFISMLVSLFGMLVIGIVYQSIKMLEGKSLVEIVDEISQAFKSIFSKR